MKQPAYEHVDRMFMSLHINNEQFFQELKPHTLYKIIEADNLFYCNDHTFDGFVSLRVFPITYIVYSSPYTVFLDENYEKIYSYDMRE